MVVGSRNSIQEERILPIELPKIDLSAERSIVMKLIVKACEEYGFFNVINHGVPNETIAKMEEMGFDFFAKPMEKKKQASPSYGCKNIGLNGDIGEVEYLLLNGNASSIAQLSNKISIDDPSNIRYVH